MEDDDPVSWDSYQESFVFDRDRHILYLQMMYQLLPSPYQGQEINRLTLAYFVISGLDILNALDRIDKEALINWVLSLQAHPKNEDTLENGQFYGFHGSRSSQFHSNDTVAATPNGSHLASTYCALAILKSVGYDLSLIDAESLLKSMKNLQQPNGWALAMRKYFLGTEVIEIAHQTACKLAGSRSFCPTEKLDYLFFICMFIKRVGYVSLTTSGCKLVKYKNEIDLVHSFMPIHTGGETDLRFVFCAAAICSMFKNWSGMDREKAEHYIISCQSYDGGFGLIPGSESHGGATYCAVASLKLMGFIEEDILSKTASCHSINVPLLLEWSLQKQAEDGGFQGRSNKPTDTCYAFWIGGVLRILRADKFINEKALRGFLLTCQSEYGGFSKFPRLMPDIYHSYYGFCAFSLLKEPGLNSLCVELGITDVDAIGL